MEPITRWVISHPEGHTYVVEREESNHYRISVVVQGWHYLVHRDSPTNPAEQFMRLDCTVDPLTEQEFLADRRINVARPSDDPTADLAAAVLVLFSMQSNSPWPLHYEPMMRQPFDEDSSPYRHVLKYGINAAVDAEVPKIKYPANYEKVTDETIERLYQKPDIDLRHYRYPMHKWEPPTDE